MESADLDQWLASSKRGFAMIVTMNKLPRAALINFVQDSFSNSVLDVAIRPVQSSYQTHLHAESVTQCVDEGL